MVGLTRAFLAAGVQCVCVSLWPVPIAASKLFTHTFYTALLNGTKASAALTEAMKTLQSSKHFSHPSNWAGEQREEPKLIPDCLSSWDFEGPQPVFECWFSCRLHVDRQ